jgi:hypothetical protein
MPVHVFSYLSPVHLSPDHLLYRGQAAMHREGFEPSTSGFVDRNSDPIELPVLVRYAVRRGDLDSPTSRLSGGCSASELTARKMSFISILQCAKLDSNQQPPRCKRGALAN